MKRKTAHDVAKTFLITFFACKNKFTKTEIGRIVKNFVGNPPKEEDQILKKGKYYKIMRPRRHF
jgi:hypothetical protein